MSLTDETRAQLAAPLDASRVKTRDSGRRGGELSYLETHDVIRRANEIFGHGNWGHEITELVPLGAVKVKGRDDKEGISIGYRCVVRLTVAGCVPVSGAGYGDAVEYRDSAQVTAHELALKEAESDALKRALMKYGDQFGLALYDKAAGQNGHLTYANGSGGPATSPSSPRVNAGDDGAASTGWSWPFGKHKGLTLADTPSSYLDWYVDKGTDADTRQRIIDFRNGGQVAVGVTNGTVDTDSDIPFLPSIDGLGN